MTVQHTFEFGKKHIEEIKIGEKIYTIDMSDKNLREMQVKFNGYYQKSQELEAASKSVVTEEEQIKYFDEAVKMMKELTDGVLGDGSGEELYKLSGESILEMGELVKFLSDLIGNKLNGTKEQQRQKYINNKKQKNGNYAKTNRRTR